ncbi:Metallophosphoesterase domain-containing protein 1 [Pleurostoma richardsiae]|uniref:Metallophosphoesterase domain-containing protein 1 n=1 Tax=Pleurostoma richardsiae TaxID=41990 RepID=A0AA38VEJ3_9PEZI|nr:Metallophosphoesterase domain-containing protein 1 [Pleurostoma richardsiae]
MAALPDVTKTTSSTPLRRTRFVCISDTHNCTVKLPRGDVLVHAGDLTNQGSYSELSRAVQWLEKADFEAKIVVAGNHDVTLDSDFYAEHGSCFHNQELQNPSECLSLLTSSPTITYLNHSSATIRLQDLRGPRTTFAVFGSPYSPRIERWAFGYEAAAASESPAESFWSDIPFDTDIVVTHGPPYTHCDEFTSRRLATGCEDLRQALWRVRPRLAVCGHVHEGRGSERVRWDIDGKSGAAYKEAGVLRWDDPGAGPGNRKMSLVDLTGRTGGNQPLDNDGSRHQCGFPPGETAREPPVQISGQQLRGTALPGSGTRGLGGNPEGAGARCDRLALCCRMGRRETCVVNCAVVATSWPHHGGKRLNKPIVVDIDLPAWDAEVAAE